MLVIQGLVIDGISWRFLLNDLEQAAQQWARSAGRKPLVLSEKTQGVEALARRLQAHCREGISEQERSHWIALLSEAVPSLPVN